MLQRLQASYFFLGPWLIKVFSIHGTPSLGSQVLERLSVILFFIAVHAALLNGRVYQLRSCYMVHG